MSTIINKRGFTLVETLMYAAGLVLLLGAMTGFLFYMYNWYQNATIPPRMDRIGVSLVDKIVKDIRSGTTVNSAQSSFGVTNGALSFDANVSTGIITKYFTLNNSRLTYQENGGAVSYVSPVGVNISRFYIMATSTLVSKGVKFDIDITFMTRAGTTTQTYSGFAILRQSYE